MYYLLPSALLVKFSHDPLSPLHGSNHHASGARTVSRVEQIFCGLEVAGNKIPATMAITRFRPSSIAQSILNFSPFVRQLVLYSGLQDTASNC